MSLGQALQSLVNVLPQLLVFNLVVRLVFNEFMHIVMEPVKAGEVTEDSIVNIVGKYNADYGIPASYEDIILRLSPFGSMFDKWYSDNGKKIEPRVSELLDKLVKEGKIKRVDSGYVK